MAKIENLISRIGHGKNNAVSRTELAADLGVSDRVMRKLIAEARQLGFFIINNQDAHGYYIETDPDELFKWYKQENSRIKKEYQCIRPIRTFLKTSGYKV